MRYFFFGDSTGSPHKGVEVLHDGRLYTDPDYLISTDAAKRHFKELKNVTVGTSSRKKRVEEAEPSKESAR